jgi:hypothetical protein
MDVGLTNPLRKDILLRNPPESVEEDHRGGQDPHRVVAPVKKMKKELE